MALAGATDKRINDRTVSIMKATSITTVISGVAFVTFKSWLNVRIVQNTAITKIARAACNLYLANTTTSTTSGNIITSTSRGAKDAS